MILAGRFCSRSIFCELQNAISLIEADWLRARNKNATASRCTPSAATFRTETIPYKVGPFFFDLSE